MQQTDYQAPVPFTGDARIMAEYTYWLSRAELWMAEAARADKYCQDYQKVGAFVCAALAARDTAESIRNYQRCLVNAESWL